MRYLLRWNCKPIATQAYGRRARRTDLSRAISKKRSGPLQPLVTTISRDARRASSSPIRSPTALPPSARKPSLSECKAVTCASARRSGSGRERPAVKFLICPPENAGFGGEEGFQPAARQVKALFRVGGELRGFLNGGVERCFVDLVRFGDLRFGRSRFVQCGENVI